MKPPQALPAWLLPHQAALEAFADLLATDGVDHGLIGPREVPRLWTRHLLNCAVVVDPAAGLVPAGVRVADVGSGAGLPGLVWALARPDLTIVLVEPLLRRSAFLSAAVTGLSLDARVSVVRDRAEALARTPSWVPVDIVTARAVAPLDRLLQWTVPLLRRGGGLVALKGSSAEDEVRAAAATAHTLGMIGLSVVRVGTGVIDPPTTVVIGSKGPAQ